MHYLLSPSKIGPGSGFSFHPFIKPQYYLIIIVYLIIICTCFYYIEDDEFQISSLIISLSAPQSEGNVFRNSTKHMKEALKPAIGKFVEKTRTVPKQIVLMSLIIALLTYVVMSYVMPKLMNYWRILDWRKHHTEKDELQHKQRLIKLMVGNDTESSSVGKKGCDKCKYTCETTSKKSLKSSEDTNYISTTNFDIKNSFTLSIVSFIYSTFVYLGQPIQVWCLAISFVQLFVFHTGKSFYPLAIFTIFIAVVETKNQLSKWKTDKEKNERPVKMADGTFKQRGELRCGDEVIISIGEEVPADLILTDIIVEDNKMHTRKPILYMNEVTVTGENDPVKKSLLTEEIKSIRIDNLLLRSAVINEKIHVDESYIIFANSVIASIDQNISLKGIVAWSGTETKALHSSGANTSKQPTPFLEYTNKGFFISLALMLFLATVNTIASMFFGVEGGEEHSFGKVLITQIMFINMMVPQGLEQLRTTVCHLLAFNFRSNVNCNNPLSVDVLAYVNRVISDKTGTLTVNLMQPKYTMLFLDEEASEITSSNDLDNLHVVYESGISCETDITKCHKANCFAIYSTTGVEPEERAIREMISPYSRMLSHWPSETQDIEPGSVEFSVFGTDCIEKRHELKIVAFFGFIREFLCKSCLFQDTETGEYFVGVQAGDELFWRGETGISTHPSSEKKLEKWSSFHEVEDKDAELGLGAPRTWSHGIKPIDESEAQHIISQWRNSFSVLDLEERLSTQKEIVKEALTNVRLTSITHMVDRYREGVKSGIKQLNKAGKQFCICTGDSFKNAKLIATHLSLPNHVIIQGTSGEELMRSLDNAEAEAMKGSCTFFFDRSTMEFLRNLYTNNGSKFKGPIFERLLLLINMKGKKQRFQHSLVFCRSTPGLKLWCVKLLQYHHAQTFAQQIFYTRNYVLAMGDGTNDLQMLKACDISYGIKSGETEDVCKQTDIWATEWSPLLDLLEKDGFEKAVMLGTMVKATFWKHWCFALTLWSDLLFQGFPLYPRDPTEPMLMLVFNGVVFGQIASHVSSDIVSDFSQFRKTNMMSMRAFLRWVVGASVTAVCTHWIIRWLFPMASSSHFGAYVQVSHAVSITVYLYLTTNTWSDDEDVVTFKNQPEKFYKHSSHLSNSGLSLSPSVSAISTNAINTTAIGMNNDVALANAPTRPQPKVSYSRLYFSILSFVVTFAVSMFIYRHVEDTISKVTALAIVIPSLGYPTLYLLKCFMHDVPFIEKSIRLLWDLRFNEILISFVKFSHTPHMRVLPIIGFSLIIKILSGIPVLGAAFVMGMSVVATTFTFLIFVSKMGFLRALLDGRSVAVGLICFLIGIWVGRSTCSVKI